ncbi:minor capsid protein [Liquorilactobacillus nagelii]|uniref:minor capsid protein n=1 Tax=Liquorilactobacillus nagelii TaxID=82688 RepID=UPI0006F02FD1|nr:minor capsid protein [Liquorilactobacillus nagelii]KRL40724.1 phage Mu protein F like protein [Liquorilactobacillus nagelii DSM 13675]QYH53686.1 minor capsid protein [Liquorilactobacillus nagelii DSM 13675]
MTKPTTNSSYWKKRETIESKWIDANIKNDADYAKLIQKHYEQLTDTINKQISDFYMRYASKENLGMDDAVKAISKFDVRAFEKIAAKMVKEKDFSSYANDRLKIYNATMRINRLEYLKSQIGLAMTEVTNQEEQRLNQNLNQSYIDEVKRQAGILSKHKIDDVLAKVSAVVNASFHGATWSQRIWVNQDTLKAELDKLLTQSMVQGINPNVLASQLRKQVSTKVKNASYMTERLMRTETARVQDEAQIASFKKFGIEYVKWVAEPTACEQCQDIAAANDGFYPLTKAPGIPVHANCRCSKAAADKPKWLADETADTVKGIQDFENKDLKAQIGENNYEVLKNKINSPDFDPRLKSVLTRYQDKFKFDYKNYDRIGDSSESENYNALTKKILAYKNSFTGNSYNKPLQAVFHEMGHAVDNFATKDLLGKEFLPTGKMTKVRIAGKMKKVEGSTVHISSSKEYDLAGLIKDDLNNTIYSGIPSIESLGPKPRRRGQS